LARSRVTPEEAKRRAEELAMAFAKSSSPTVPFHTAHALPASRAACSAASKVPVVWSVSVDWSRPGEVVDSPLLLSVNIESELVTVVG
jgi:hypothetical protein